MGTTQNNVIDLSALKRKEFQVGDKILELDTSDLNIVTRLGEVYPKLLESGDKVANLSKYVDDESDDLNLQEFAAAFREVDKTMREAIDFIFDSNVSEICLDHGSLFDPINGEYRFEHVINALIPLYEENLETEMKKVQKRIKSHTTKYTKKK